MNDRAYLLGDVGDEQRHFGRNTPVLPDSSNGSEKPNTWRPEPGTACEARSFLDGEWCKWKPVTIRGYFEGDVWLHSGSTCFTCPISAMEFRPKLEAQRQCSDADVIEALATELTQIAKQESNRVEYQSGFLAAVNEMFIKANHLRQRAKGVQSER